MGEVSKLSLTALAVSILFLISVNWAVIVAAADDHPGLAGWVQGIGTILAILATAWFARRQERADRRRERVAAILSLSAALPRLSAIHLEAAKVAEKLEVAVEARNSDNVEIPGSQFSPEQIADIAQIVTRLPDDILMFAWILTPQARSRLTELAQRLEQLQALANISARSRDIFPAMVLRVRITQFKIISEAASDVAKAINNLHH